MTNGVNDKPRFEADIYFGERKPRGTGFGEGNIWYCEGSRREGKGQQLGGSDRAW